MRAGVEPRRFEMMPYVRDDRGCLNRQRDWRVRHLAIDVIDPEPDPFEVERSDRPGEGLGFFDERLQLIGMRAIGAQECDEIGETALRRLAAVRGHVGTIVECRGRLCASTDDGKTGAPGSFVSQRARERLIEAQLNYCPDPGRMRRRPRIRTPRRRS